MSRKKRVRLGFVAKEIDAKNEKRVLQKRKMVFKIILSSLQLYLIALKSLIYKYFGIQLSTL